MDILALEQAFSPDDLLPFTSTRSAADIRMGILTFREKWGRTPAQERTLSLARLIRYPWHIFQYNALALNEDFALLTSGRTSRPIPDSVQAIAPEHIFIEEGARLQYCSLNAAAGPIYIGRNAEIMEGSLIRGPFAACEGAIVKMGARIYGATTLGPYSTAGGEIKNTVFFGYSNKGHDGFLGDAVIGEWCNLGAGTSASNLKNNAGEVRVWHPHSRSWLPAVQKCGLLMGDYSRAAINTSFDTGTMTGVCCNIFGSGIPPKYIPDFSWGPDPGERYQWDKVVRDIASWKKLKNQVLTETEVLTLKHIFEQS
jgi:UDP-N-acetylglucosamine diphosphorylase / glucose-1-phosphate thymidylyltransferase / UDP-N-acetylgalactosamine diphosphorylase / glucosamine-1-phosphate N-acetyltransferase / galactosamine-1-phosphate N-acetyltransferase